MRFMSETYPKVSGIPSCETIRVRLLKSAQHLDEEKIHLYFQGRMREGQEVESVEKLSADQFLVTFNDPAVVAEFCFRTHKIFATELEVLPYIKNLQKKICKSYSLDSPLILDLMKKYKMTVETMLQPHVKPIWPSSVGQVLMIEFDRSNSQEEVFKIIENLLGNISEEKMSLSAELFDMVKDLTEQELSNAVVSFDSANETLRIAAFGEDAIVRLKEALHTGPSSPERNFLHLDSYKISLLFANKFLQKIYDKYPGIRFESERRKLIFQGESSHFPEIKKEINTYLNDVQRSFVPLPRYAAILLRKKQVISHVKEKMKKKNCIASWEVKETDMISVFSMKANQLRIANEIFHSVFKPIDFTITKDLEPEMCKQFFIRIQKDYDNLFYLDQKSLIGVTVDCVEKKIQSEFKSFLETSAIQKKTISLTKAQADFLKNRKMKEIKEFCQEFGNKNIMKVTFEPDNQICVRTAEKNMANAVEFVNQLVKRFEEMKSTMVFAEAEKGDGKSKSASQLKMAFQMKFQDRTINIYEGDMTLLSVDAIVNAANREMKHGGGVAKVIVDKGGFVIQTESDDFLSIWNTKAVGVGDAIITTGGNLPCKKVIHAVGPKWTDGKSNEKNLLSKAVKTSLEIAARHDLTSIAFPAISAGSYRYPLDEAVHVIVSTVKEYLVEHPRTSLDTVTFVDTQSKVTDKFQQQIMQIFYASSLDTEIKNVDIIVNSISKNLDLSNGQLSRAILQSAGQEIQDDCNNFSKISYFEVVVTEGYKLPCTMVFHVSLPSPQAGSSMNDTIMRYTQKCLQSAEAYRASSIAFPSLGTGQLSYPPVVVAKQMLCAAQQHLSDPSSSLKEVDIIVYPKDDPVFTAFANELKNLPKIPNVNVVNEFQDQTPSTVQRIRSAIGSVVKPIIQAATSTPGAPAALPKKLPDFVLGSIRVYLINGDLLNETTDAIIHCTDASFNLKGAISRCLARKSGNAFIRDTQQKVSEMSRNHYAISTGHNLKCKHILHLDIISYLSQPEKILQTCFAAADRDRMSSVSLPQLATNGQNVPLDEMASAIVQVIPTLKMRYLREVNIVLYQANMVSTLKNAIVSAQSGNIIPKTISQSDLLRLTHLKTSDAEYQTVSKQFLSSLNRTSTIVSIEKITNKVLKIQYEAQLAKIKALNQQGKNEHILWHGTKEDVVIKICKNGFDRGYCGTNGTWHGQGVYFATQSEYSDQDTYTPRDSNSRKHMFMCRVATGLYVQGTPNLKVLPTRPNSVYTYDSAVNRIGAPTVFIIFNDVQAYPAYHITYT